MRTSGKKKGHGTAETERTRKLRAQISQVGGDRDRALGVHWQYPMSSSAEESSECGPTFVTPPTGNNARNTAQSSHSELPVVTVYMVSLSDSSDGESDLSNMSMQSTFDEIVCRFRSYFEDPNGPTKVNGMFFIPHCIEQQWFLHVIDTVSKNIYLYDFDITGANNRQRRDFTERIIRLLGYAFKFYSPNIDLQKFTFKYGKCSQQQLRHDSGLMMLLIIRMLHMEKFSRDGSLTIDAKELDFYRIQMSCQLILNINNELVDIVKDEIRQSLERV